MDQNPKLVEVQVEYYSKDQIQIYKQYQLGQMIDGLFFDIHERNRQKKHVKDNKQISVILNQSLLTNTNINDNNSNTLDEMIKFQQRLSIVFSYYSFKNLVSLHLVDSNLNNCQFLQFMNLPDLQYLILNNNKIHNVQSFNKANLPSLMYLSLVNNGVKELNIKRFKIGSKFSNLALYNQSSLSVFNQDISFIAKLQLNKSTYISVKDQKRIKQLAKTIVLFKKVNYIGAYS